MNLTPFHFPFHFLFSFSHVTNGENKLLGNVLDALDRVFDRHLAVVDLCALLFATAEALRATQFGRELEGPIVNLRTILTSGASAEAQRDQALAVTDKLRKYLAELLPINE